MKKLLLGVLLTVGLLSLVSAKQFFVKVGGMGDGASWQTAAGDLQMILAQCQAGDEVWVAAGTYLPSYTGDRNASFFIPDGVQVFGGFAGFERTAEERNPQVNMTMLSGNIGSPASAEDNSYTIVRFRHAGAATTLDGFTLAFANANGMSYDADPSVSGGAIFNDGTYGNSSPLIRNCIFRENRARQGGAIYNAGNSGQASPMIQYCLFLNNKADFKGGAIYNDGMQGISNGRIENCSFEGNSSDYGAGILNCGTAGESSPLIKECHFVNNFSLSTGSAVYNLREGRGTCNPLLVQCILDDNNRSTLGEGQNTGLVQQRTTGAQLRNVGH